MMRVYRASVLDVMHVLSKCYEVSKPPHSSIGLPFAVVWFFNKCNFTETFNLDTWTVPKCLFMHKLPFICLRRTDYCFFSNNSALNSLTTWNDKWILVAFIVKWLVFDVFFFEHFFMNVIKCLGEYAFINTVNQFIFFN